MVARRTKRATDICKGRAGCFQKTFLADNEAPPTQGNLLGRMDKMYKHYSVTMEIKVIHERTSFNVENVLHFAASSYGEKIRNNIPLRPSCHKKSTRIMRQNGINSILCQGEIKDGHGIFASSMLFRFFRISYLGKILVGYCV